MPRFLCIGHRGARGHEPENTVRSVRRALELGANGIEVDVYFVDGELVVIHDDVLDRTTNGTGRVAEKSFAELRALDAGKGEKIPTLREIFDVVDRRAFINIELKGPRTAVPVERLIREYVSTREWRHADFLVSSFDHEELARIANRRIRRGILYARAPHGFAETAARLRAYSLHTNIRYTHQPIVEEAHRLGLKVFVYTVNSPRALARMRAIGADGVFTDFPERCARS
jgi:glycerophosphoryl diester phosphodiesterase